ncbi:MAG: hypothetical protein ACP5JU_03615, partial [Minisyncoccia bacterium]
AINSFNIPDIVGGCLENRIKDIVKSSVTHAISTIPFANVVWILANGIIGGLSNQIIIEGKISTSGAVTLFNVTNRIACYANREEVKGSFKSSPPLSESIGAFFKGFLTSVASLYSSDAGQVVDIIPIVREVDLPYQGYYFAVPATPGVYKITISVNARSFIQSFTDNIKKGIGDTLNSINKDISKESLYRKIQTVVYNHLSNILGSQSNKDLVDKYAKKENTDTNEMSDLDIYIVSIPPYMIGRSENEMYKYDLSFDIFGIIRQYVSNKFDEIQEKIENKLCSGKSTEAKKLSTSQVSILKLNIFNINTQQNIVMQICTSVLSNVIKNSLKNFIEQHFDNIRNTISANLNKYHDSGDYSGDQCTVKGVIYSIAKDVIAGKNGIIEQVGSFVTQKLDEATGSICSIFSSFVASIIDSALLSGLGDVLNYYNLFYSTTGQMSFSPFGHVHISPVALSSLSASASDTNLLNNLCQYRSSQFFVYYLKRLYNSLTDVFYVPSYFLSIKPITTLKESSTQRWCYRVAMAPYFIYTVSRLDDISAKKSIIIDALDIIADNYQNLKIDFDNFISNKKVKYTFNLFNLKYLEFSMELDLLKTKDNEKRYLCVYPPFFLSVLWFETFQDYFYGSMPNCGGMVNALSALNLDNNDEKLNALVDKLNMMRGSRGVNLPAVVGLNSYFSAFKVYPVFSVYDRVERNPYYFVVPFAAPAREFYVLGVVGDVVVFDGDGKKPGKPFYYVDITK